MDEKIASLMVIVAVVAVSGCVQTKSPANSDSVGEHRTLKFMTENPSEAEQAKELASQRLHDLGVSNSISISGSEITVEVPRDTNISGVFEKGSMRATTYFPIDKERTLNLGSEVTVKLNQGQLLVNGQSYPEEEWFTFKDKEMRFTNGSIEVLAYDSEDVINIDRARITQVGRDNFQAQIYLSITQQAAEEFNTQLSNYRRGKEYLENIRGADANLTIRIDGEKLNSLRLSNSLKRTVITEPLISFGESTRDDAMERMNRLRAKLSTGMMPELQRLDS